MDTFVSVVGGDVETELTHMNLAEGRVRKYLKNRSSEFSLVVRAVDSPKKCGENKL